MQNRKELINEYKNKKQIGGICKITNTEINKIFVFSVPSIDGYKNRFEFSKKCGSCVSMKLQDDWNKYGLDAFVFEVVEELEKGDDQSPQEFTRDLNVLLELYLNKLKDENLY